MLLQTMSWLVSMLTCHFIFALLTFKLEWLVEFSFVKKALVQTLTWQS